MATYKTPCINCGSLIDGGSNVCPKCGSRNPFGYNCPSCRKDIQRDELLCSGCGRPLTTACPYCHQPAFIGDEACRACGGSLLILCENKRCRQPQFFENTKCTACGKPIKHSIRS